jgi:hypothetical protein
VIQLCFETGALRRGTLHAAIAVSKIIIPANTTKITSTCCQAGPDGKEGTDDDIVNGDQKS